MTTASSILRLLMLERILHQHPKTEKILTLKRYQCGNWQIVDNGITLQVEYDEVVVFSAANGIILQDEMSDVLLAQILIIQDQLSQKEAKINVKNLQNL